MMTSASATLIIKRIHMLKSFDLYRLEYNFIYLDMFFTLSTHFLKGEWFIVAY